MYRILLPKLKCVYFYLPKVACTSIRKLLADAEGLKYYPNWYIEDGKHIKTKFKLINTNNARKLEHFFKFAIVRNPLDRLVSCYFDKVVGTRTLPNSKFVRNGVYIRFIEKFGKKIPFGKMSFNDFVDFVCSIPNNKADGHFKSQKALLEKSFHWLDYIGKFEELNASMGAVCDRLGIPNNLERLWSSRREKNYLKYYNNSSFKKAINRYSDDINQFNYQIDWEDLRNGRY